MGLDSFQLCVNNTVTELDFGPDFDSDFGVRKQSSRFEGSGVVRRPEIDFIDGEIHFGRSNLGSSICGVRNKEGLFYINDLTKYDTQVTHLLFIFLLVSI